MGWWRTDEADESVDVANLQHRVLGSQRHATPQATVVGEQTPFLADACDVADLAVTQEAEAVKQDLVGKLVYVFLKHQAQIQC